MLGILRCFKYDWKLFWNVFELFMECVLEFFSSPDAVAFVFFVLFLPVVVVVVVVWCLVFVVWW